MTEIVMYRIFLEISTSYLSISNHRAKGKPKKNSLLKPYLQRNTYDVIKSST